MLYACATQLSGTGTINTCGIISDVGVVFDSAHGVKPMVVLPQPGQKITVNLDMAAGSSTLGVGCAGAGSLTIQDGIKVTCSLGYLGYGSGSTGAATVAGSGSTWIIKQGGGLFVGNSGSGTLSILSGGSVSSDNNIRGYIGYGPGSTGVVNVDGSGSTWTMSNGSLYVGNSGSGTLSIAGGGSVTTHGPVLGDWVAYIGYSPGSTGVVEVSGVNSNWTENIPLYIGNSGSGTLSITNGGQVTDAAISSYLGYASGSSGIAKVDGSGSLWAVNSSSLFIGWKGSGTLSVTSGGSVTMMGLVVYNSSSLLAIDVGCGSPLTVSSVITGAVMNNGTIRVLAGAGIPASGTSYSPILAGDWGGTGTYQALGGAWDTTSHQFTASSVTAAASGTPVPLDRKLIQRALVSDSGTGGTGWVVGASFPAAANTANMTFTATAMNGTTLDALRSQLPTNESILSGWTFSTTDYTVDAANPIYLSFLVGAGCNSDDLEVWHYDGGEWMPYPAFDLTYDGNYASFTANGLSGYAMTVPEPGTLALLAGGVLGLLTTFAWRKRKRA
jgi:T5SS/PEP-CTERM-associated repeat protein